MDFDEYSARVHRTYDSESFSDDSCEEGVSDFDDEYHENKPIPKPLESDSLVVCEPFEHVASKKKRKASLTLNKHSGVQKWYKHPTPLKNVEKPGCSDNLSERNLGGGLKLEEPFKSFVPSVYKVNWAARHRPETSRQSSSFNIGSGVNISHIPGSSTANSPKMAVKQPDGARTWVYKMERATTPQMYSSVFDFLQNQNYEQCSSENVFKKKSMADVLKGNNYAHSTSKCSDTRIDCATQICETSSHAGNVQGLVESALEKKTINSTTDILPNETIEVLPKPKKKRNKRNKKKDQVKEPNTSEIVLSTNIPNIQSVEMPTDCVEPRNEQILKNKCSTPTHDHQNGTSSTFVQDHVSTQTDFAEKTLPYPNVIKSVQKQCTMSYAEKVGKPTSLVGDRYIIIKRKQLPSTSTVKSKQVLHIESNASMPATKAKTVENLKLLQKQDTSLVHQHFLTNNSAKKVVRQLDVLSPIVTDITPAVSNQVTSIDPDITNHNIGDFKIVKNQVIEQILNEQQLNKNNIIDTKSDTPLANLSGSNVPELATCVDGKSPKKRTRKKKIKAVKFSTWVQTDSSSYHLKSVATQTENCDISKRAATSVFFIGKYWWISGAVILSALIIILRQGRMGLLRFLNASKWIRMLFEPR